MTNSNANKHKNRRVRKVPTAREVALDSLTRIEQEQAYSNLLLNHSLEQAKLSPQDTALATELVYGTIQRLNTIDYFLEHFLPKGLASLQPWVRALLRMSFYQMHYLQRIPDHAAVSEAVKLAKRKGHAGIAGLVNGVLRNVIRKRNELTVPHHLPQAEQIALLHSHPVWLVERWISQFGADETARICEANNRSPKVSLRVNTMRNTREELMALLRAESIKVHPSVVSPVGLIVEGAGNMAHHPTFKEGLFSIQDESSMLVADALDPKPGMKVLDCCAAPGGKTTHIAEKMQGQGIVWANDLHAHKEKLIRKQVDRLGLTNVFTRTGNAVELTNHFAPNSFDRILLDAPCSGHGVIRRKPDLKWTKQQLDSKELSNIQLQILLQVSQLLKQDGIIVYSTCTLESTENEGVVHAFLQQAPEFELDEGLQSCFPKQVSDMTKLEAGMQRVLPHHFESDGFFISRLRKKV